MIGKRLSQERLRETAGEEEQKKEPPFSTGGFY